MRTFRVSRDLSVNSSRKLRLQDKSKYFELFWKGKDNANHWEEIAEFGR